VSDATAAVFILIVCDLVTCQFPSYRVSLVMMALGLCVCHKPSLPDAAQWSTGWSPHWGASRCIIRISYARQTEVADRRNVYQCSRLAWWAIQSP
jgi:hypothetical protein